MGISILIADDRTVSRIGTREVLERDPDITVVGEASDGSEAVELATELRPDVVLIELDMPDQSGISVVKQLKKMLPSVRVLALTAYDDDAFLREFASNGVSGYLLKRSTPEQILEAVRAVARGEEGWVSPHVVSRLLKLGSLQAEMDAYNLDQRDLELLECLSDGLGNTAIAERLHLSVGTIKNRLGATYQKIGVQTRAEATAWACDNLKKR